MTKNNPNEAAGSSDRLSDEQFAEAREQYELGQATLVELADHYGVSRQALSRRFKRHGVQKGSRAAEIEKAKKQAERETAERFSDKRAEMIEETRLQGLNALKQARLITQKTLVDQIKSTAASGRTGPGAFEDIDGDLKALQRYTKSILENVEGALRILKSDEHVDEDDLPGLVIEDLTSDEILNHHKMTGALPEDATLEDLNIEGISIDGSDA